MCVIHVHTDAGVGVSAQKHGLLPLTQNALLVLPQLAYHEYEGVALNLDERERLVKDIGDKNLMLLRNHGTLAVGPTAAAAFIGIFFLERACAQQVAALSGGAETVLIAPEAAQEEARGQSKGLGMVSGLAWAGLKRRLDRANPGYDS
jgi:ribulose-5-phosphate 4-epimerase/fuculose-1-phosphate aldolase